MADLNFLLLLLLLLVALGLFPTQRHQQCKMSFNMIRKKVHSLAILLGTPVESNVTLYSSSAMNAAFTRLEFLSFS